jgi:hypothetical protein
MSNGFAIRFGIYLSTYKHIWVKTIKMIRIERSERKKISSKGNLSWENVSIQARKGKTPAQRYREWKGTSIPGRGMAANPRSSLI